MEYILKTKKLSKRYGNKIVLNNLEINVPRGAIYGLVGKNGAGKTTLMRIISGLVRPSNGEYELKLKNNKNKKLKDIGILIENPGLYLNMTASENIEYFKLLFGIEKEYDTEGLLKSVGLENSEKKKVKNFSLGMKQRLGIAIALIGNPELLILDEPINGLDAQGIIEIRNIIQKLNRESGITVIISSHILSELSKVVTHYGIINNGIVIEEFNSEKLLEKCHRYVKIIVEPENSEKTIRILKERFGSKNYNIEKLNSFKVFGNINIAELNDLLVANDIKVRALSYENEEIESYFIKKVLGGI
ncbi:MAG: ATP-binding cassette domain-containing protein [Clostridium sp.]